MSLAPGTRLGVYEVVRPLGAGGMGEVYLARDTRLQRDVAVKVLSDAVSRDSDRLARFEREARVLASLNHPNIAQIFGLEESTDVRALVMELVPGQTLDDAIRATRARGGGLPVDRALSIARQMAEGLEAAHEAGIVHRDLKPANVKVRDDGVVKVLDFGLAKAAAGDTGSDSAGAAVAVESPTMTSSEMTLAGSVLGTAAYMSPEQARGGTVDKRTDIWAFGAILFEMLTGRRLFDGATASDSIAAVLTRDLEADLAALPPTVPPYVRALAARCLERDAKRRLRDIGEARHLLEQGSAAPSSAMGFAATAGPPPPSSPRRRLVFALAVAAAVVLAGAMGVYWSPRPGSLSPGAVPPATHASHAQSIAVLPFVNQSGTDDEYFSDGMTDELASALMKVPGLRVAARSSAFSFKGKTPDPREVGEKLHVTSVLEGTVRRAGSRLRVTAQLVNAADGLAIWSERYEREVKDVFAVQDDITGAIVSALQLRLGAGATSARPAGVRSAEAHDLVLRGRFFMLKQTEDGLRKGLDYFQQALVKDPGYAPAYAGMSFAWAWLSDAYDPPNDAEPKAKAAALKALELDPSNVEARTMLAIIRYIYDWDIQQSVAAFRRALQDNPNSMDAYYLYSIVLCATKQFDEGLAAADHAIELDPLSPVAAWARATCFMMARRWDDAIEEHRKVGELDPNFFYFESPGGVAYREKGMYAESVAEFERVREVTGEPVSGLAVTYARMGRTADARRILQEFLARAATQYVSPEQVAMVYANLGDKDQAFTWLDKAIEERSAFFVNTIYTSPAYDPLRSDPRFGAVLQKIRPRR